MIQALSVSNILLWVALLALGVVVVALTRQIGLLHERLAPFGALATQRGPEVGEAAPELQLADLSGRPVAIGGAAAAQRTLLFFLSPTCPVCDTLLPTLLRVAAEESPGLRLVLASDGDPDEHQAFRREKGLEAPLYVLSTELGLRFAVAKLPTAVLIDEQGIVRAKGIVNTREHLESLFTADELGVGSIQELLDRKRPLATTAGAEALS
ncbi:MAG: methylamine dehydrogenase accessory protein MauD [Deltaproteobacteria bacterium]|nr:methylamine dehydrogenase accessory protein MauD [Deltaproteobacteria bacterium]MBW2421178.1 methylamine dehydrogenase accessory protein MauD [Deltaproteobacteria bacterium]